MEPKKNWFRRHIVLTVLMILFGIPFLMGIISGIAGTSNKNSQSNNQNAQANVEQPKPKVVFPIEIVSSKITKDSIGTPILSLSIKNTGKKIIDAIEIDALFYDNFNEPAGKFGTGDNSIIATSQEKINPGETITREWNLAVYDSATKVDGVAVKRVHFTDGETLSND